MGGLILANFNHLQDEKKIKTGCQQKSATRMTASVPKQDPNTHKVQKNAYLPGQKHYLQMFRVIPFAKLQNDMVCVGGGWGGGGGRWWGVDRLKHSSAIHIHKQV